jgi:RNA polymerase sigma-70 factor, ECF subfamily
MTHRHRNRLGDEDWDWGHVRALCLREACRLLGPSSTAADDAAQEALIRAWRHRSRCRSPSKPEAWIARIARHEALRALTHRAERPLAHHPDIADPRQDTVDLVDCLDLRRALTTLDGQDLRLLVGRYWQDLSSGELAMQLGLAEVTVRVRLHRIRQRLQDTLMEL